MKTLIIYGTKHGCTRRCAQLLKEKLSGDIDVMDIKSDISLDINKYSKIIIGGSIYMGQIQKEITEVCNKYLDVLTTKNIGVFICCMNESNVENQINDNFPKELLKHSSAQGYFGGAFNFQEMNFLERFIVRIVSKSMAKEDSNMKNLDMKKYKDMIEEKNIINFAEAMNKIS